jgi:hypothetical protein
MKALTSLIICALLLAACSNPSNDSKKERTSEIKFGEFNSADPINLAYKFPSYIKHYLDTCDKPWANQMAGKDYSYLGMEKETGEQFYGKYGKPTAMNDSAFAIFQANYKPTSAQEYILDRAKDEQLVIINEAHHKPKHRFFTRTLLDDLYVIGYRYLGLETLSNRGAIDTELNNRKHPVKHSGAYSKEPQFGNLIREALEIGYTLFPYEGHGLSGKEREISQAQNIAAFMEQNNEGKYLIHCGYDHAKEGQIGGRMEVAMAGRLTEYTGINPLTVNQTKFDNRFDSSYLNPLSKRLDLNEPTIFIDSNQLSYLGSKNDSAFDIMVFHEQSTYSRRKANWLIEGENQWISIPDTLVKLKKPYMALAFIEGEEISEAIPYDLDIINEKRDSILLALKPGKYNLLIQNQEDSAVVAKLKAD